MVQQAPAQLDSVFRALGHPARREMLRRLTGGERSIGELAAPFRMSFAGASKHVRALERAGLVKRRIEGRTHFCRLAPAPMAGALEWLRFYERFWMERLDALERELRKPDAKEKSKSPPTGRRSKQ